LIFVFELSSTVGNKRVVDLQSFEWAGFSFDSHSNAVICRSRLNTFYHFLKYTPVMGSMLYGR
jgi:hypothetical protein